MKMKGLVLILLGILGAAFVSTFDIIMRKPVNDITGPKSTPALAACALAIIAGIYFCLSGRKKAIKS